MTAEAWPTEDAATRAVDAAARKIYEISVANQREITDPEVQFAEFDDLDPALKLAYREAALPAVWAALEDLPDPRRTAWELGYSSGFRSGADLDRTEPDNPYPES